MAVAKKETSSLDVARSKILEMVKDIEANYSASSPEEAIAQMSQSIFDADNFEDMFSLIGGTTPSEDLFNTALLIQEISFNASDYEEGFPFYATFTGKKLATGEDFVTNCGGWQVVVVAYKCLKNNWLPRNMCFHRQEKATKRGYHPINIYPWDGEEPF